MTSIIAPVCVGVSFLAALWASIIVRRMRRQHDQAHRALRATFAGIKLASDKLAAGSGDLARHSEVLSDPVRSMVRANAVFALLRDVNGTLGEAVGEASGIIEQTRADREESHVNP